MTVYFISGHLDLTPGEFQEHYVPRLELALAEAGSTFIVGDARGTDAMTQAWLVARGVGNDRGCVYHMFATPRNHVTPLATQGGFGSDRQRDEAMTQASDMDIAWVRPGRESSGTAKNLSRRLVFKSSP